MPPGNLEKLHPVSEGIFSRDLSPFSNCVAADGTQNFSNVLLIIFLHYHAII